MGNFKSKKKLDTSNTPANEGRKKTTMKTPTPAKVPAPRVPVAKAVPPPKIEEEPPKVVEPPKVEEEPPKPAEATKIEEPAVKPKKSIAPEPPKEAQEVVEKPAEPEIITKSETIETAPKTEEIPKNTEATTDVEAAKIQQSSVDGSKKLIDFYYFAPSPPCRAVMMLAKVIGLELNMKVCNIFEGDHMKEDFVKINPQHCIPTMDDNGYVLWESRAIMGYLVSQYAKDDSLYPSSPNERAIVDQRLFFDVGTLFAKFAEYYMPVLFAGAPLNPEKLKSLEEALGIFNTILEGTMFVAGNDLTIADISLVVTISNIDAFGFDLSAYPNIQCWFAKTKEAMTPFGYEEINQAGANIMADFLKSKLG